MRHPEPNWLTATDGLTRIEQHQRNLAIFVDYALRYPLGVRELVEENLKAVSFLYQEFQKELPKEIDKPENGRAFEIFLKGQFLPMIDRYCQWYDNHKADFKSLDWNYYSDMRNWMLSTKKEIEKYYPNNVTPTALNQGENLNQVRMALYYFYTNQTLPANCKTRLKNYYREFSAPGEQGKNNRRESGSQKRGLSQRLKDFEAINDKLNDDQRTKLNEDKLAVLQQIESL